MSPEPPLRGDEPESSGFENVNLSAGQKMNPGYEIVSWSNFKCWTEACGADQFRRQRGGHKVYRSIADLLKHPNIFAHLHQRFSWILKAGGKRISEKLLEGPPKEELLTDLEAQLQNDADSLGTSSLDESASGNVCSPVFVSLRHMAKILGKQKFKLLAYHVIQGNQLIVRGDDRRTVRSALNMLKVLLPSGCCSCIAYSSGYKDSWRCNFLGLSPEVDIPAHVLSSELFVLLDIVRSQQDDHSKKTDAESSDDDFSDHSFIVCGKEKSPVPTILQKIENSLENENISDRVFEHMLLCLKEEWMDKVKVVFKFSRSGPTNNDDKEKLLRVLGTRPEDEIVLKFWMTGLNRQYRSHLLTCSSSGSASPTPPTA